MRRFARYAAIFLCVFGIKLLVLRAYSVSVPYWDEWDAEALELYKPWLEGRLSFSHLVAAHNEHRIVMSRLWAPVLFIANGGWDPQLTMVGNALVHSLTAVLFFHWLRRVLGEGQLIPLSLSVVFLFAFPYHYR